MSTSISMRGSTRMSRELSTRILIKAVKILQVVFRELYIQRILRRLKGRVQWLMQMDLWLDLLMVEMWKMVVYLEQALLYQLLKSQILEIQINLA